MDFILNSYKNQISLALNPAFNKNTTYFSLLTESKRLINLSNMKLIEFAFKSDEYYKIALFDLNDISSIEQNDKTTCVLVMKDGRRYILPGTHRGLTNRFIYGFGKVIEPHQDPILRPSVTFYHQPEKAEEDKIFFDTYQFHAFKSAMERFL